MAKLFETVKLKDLEEWHPYVVHEIIESFSFGKKSYVCILTDLDDTQAKEMKSVKFYPTQVHAFKGIFDFEEEALFMIIGFNEFTNKDGEKISFPILSGMSRNQYTKLLHGNFSE